MGNILANDVLTWCSQVLIESTVNTTLGTSVAPGNRTATPGSMVAIYVGAQIVVDVGASQEVVTVTAVNNAAGTSTPVSFTAVFANSHSSAAQLIGATFPSGQPPMFLFTQTEMLSYLLNAQQDYLLRVRLLITVTTMPYSQSVRFYTQPATTIRLERIARQNGNDPTTSQPTYIDLFNTSAADLDMIVQNWMLDTGDPTNWFQDSVSESTFGVYPLPMPSGEFEIWFADSGVTSLSINSTLSVPDIFTPALKYKILQMAFSKDGEQRDAQRAKFCEEMYKMWVMMGVKFIRGEAASMEENEKRSGMQALMSGGQA